MCEPTTMFLVSSALSGVQALAAASAQDAQADYTNKLAIQSAQNAVDAQITDTKQINLGIIENEAVTSQDAFNTTKQAEQLKSTTITTSGENGVNGVSIDNLVGDYERQKAVNNDILNYNSHLRRQQGVLDAKGAHSRAQSRRNSAASRIQAKSNPFATALRIGGGVIDAGVKYKNWGGR